MDCSFQWIGFYEELADKLRLYTNDRKSLLTKIISAFKDSGVSLPTIELKGVKPYDIDPFTVFSLFNRQLALETRIAIATGYKQQFDMSTPVPITYDGIPFMNNQKATFYAFKDYRKEHDIDNLWALFNRALDYAEEQTESNKSLFVIAFDRCIAQLGIKWNITAGLYWIRPNFYLNLDSRNRWFIGEQEKYFASVSEEINSWKTVPDGDTYLNMTEKVRALFNEEYYSFPNLSHIAFIVSEEVNAEKKKAKLELEKKQTLEGTGDELERGIHYWMYSPGPQACKWNECLDNGYMTIGWGYVGNLEDYSSRSEIQKFMIDADPNGSSKRNDSLALWEFFKEIKEGDIVYAKEGNKKIIGRGIVTGTYVYDENEDEYRHSIAVDWVNVGEWDHPWHRTVMKTLTDITKYSDYVIKMESLFENMDDSPVEPEEPKYKPYGKADFLNEVYMSEARYDELCSVLKRKKNVILQGPPGVGKTFSAKRLAFSIIGERNIDRVTMVQFHQSYSYEDFMMGYKPNDDGFELKTGAFYDFCKKAEEDPDNDYFFIIDEINRGNISKIFGELFMLIEGDKRGTELRLLYNNEKFSIPKRLYIIGMMNTADRSLAMLDYALRRRFSFFELGPAFDSDGFKKYQVEKKQPKLDKLVQEIKFLNDDISSDPTLGRGFMIGHSFLIANDSSDNWLSEVIRYDICPLLDEYWFDDPDKCKYWRDRLLEAVK